MGVVLSGNVTRQNLEGSCVLSWWSELEQAWRLVLIALGRPTGQQQLDQRWCLLCSVFVSLFSIAPFNKLFNRLLWVLASHVGYHHLVIDTPPPSSPDTCRVLKLSVTHDFLIFRSKKTKFIQYPE